MPRAFAIFLLSWGWLHVYVMYFASVFSGETINLGMGMGFVATIVFAVWVVCSTALKLIFSLDIYKKKWFSVSLFTNLCAVVYVVLMLFGAPAELPYGTYFWYHYVLAFGLVLWAVFDASLYFATRHLEE